MIQFESAVHPDVTVAAELKADGIIEVSYVSPKEGRALGLTPMEATTMAHALLHLADRSIIPVDFKRANQRPVRGETGE